ncbi:MAG: GNAT family N-acetyltransferase [Spirochaetes bacterium GWD1_27_9]|nr:MAG: GNAT family N-acetyltransferase [Spirochaetes bacterium GWB1_27_13]OHD26584.1 MAG: GNAT family N-acetyltransferase [Spirochaetes bacterium GWC1_27_15]OHD45602.1 MAG: GNAT family N-acetyltransferase [Spirochaetes bacterium GWD1_27_9]
MLKTQEFSYNGYFFSNNKNLISLDKVMEFLSKSYWATERSKETVSKSIENSECFGVYLDNIQVGFARVITDYSTTYFLCDVFIDDSHRGKGVGKKLVESIIYNEELVNLRGLLGTKDAHSLYEKYGFVRDPERFMKRLPK